MSTILKFDFQKKKIITFFWSKLSKLHKKKPNFACDNYIFLKARGNKNKHWTHSTPLKWSKSATFKKKKKNASFKIIRLDVWLTFYAIHAIWLSLSQILRKKHAKIFIYGAFWQRNTQESLSFQWKKNSCSQYFYSLATGINCNILFILCSLFALKLFCKMLVTKCIYSSQTFLVVLSNVQSYKVQL